VCPRTLLLPTQFSFEFGVAEFALIVGALVILFELGWPS
jgi:hypothetical protein